MGTQPGGTVQPDHASSRDPGHPWGGCPGSMGSARPGPRNQSGRGFAWSRESAAPSRTSQTLRISASKNGPLPQPGFIAVRERERKAASARAVDTYVHISNIICHAVRHAQRCSLLAPDICSLTCIFLSAPHINTFHISTKLKSHKRAKANHNKIILIKTYVNTNMCDRVASA